MENKNIMIVWNILLLTWWQWLHEIKPCYMGPCHHDMVHP